MMTLSNLRKIRHLSFIFILSFSFFFGIIQSARIYIMLSLYSTHHNFYHVSYPKECAFPFTNNYAGVPVCTFESVYAPDPNRGKDIIYSMLDYTNAEIIDDIHAYNRLQNKILTNRYCEEIIDGYDDIACFVGISLNSVRAIDPQKLTNDIHSITSVYIYSYPSSLRANDYKEFELRIRKMYTNGKQALHGIVWFISKNITFDKIQYDDFLSDRALNYIILHTKPNNMDYPLEIPLNKR